MKGYMAENFLDTLKDVNSHIQGQMARRNIEIDQTLHTER